MLFEIGTYVLDIDVQRTREFYLRARNLTDGCDCQGCRNYAAWAASLSGEPKTTLERMGIALEKTPEVYVNGPNGDGTLFYGGFYHLCGRILRGEEPWKATSAIMNICDADPFAGLTDGYRVAFSEKIALLEQDFPTPVVQMELLANIPFVLPEQCSY